MVNRADREFWIDYFIERLNAAETEVRRAHINEVNALEETALDIVDNTKLGKVYARYMEYSDEIARLQKLKNDVLNESGETSYSVDRSYHNEVSRIHEELIRARPWYPHKVVTKKNAIRTKLMLATTDARLAAAVRGLMAVMNIVEPKEVLDAE